MPVPEAPAVSSHEPSGDLEEADGDSREPLPQVTDDRPSASQPAPTSGLVRVLFVDTSGVGLAEVELSEGGTQAVASSDASGVALLPLAESAKPWREATLLARKHGFASDLRKIRVTNDGRTELGSWVLYPAAVAQGVVLDPGGRPLASIEVAVLDEERPGLDWERLRWRSIDQLERPVGRTTSDSLGRFVLEGIRAHPSRLIAVDPGGHRSAGISSPVLPAPGEIVRGIELVMGEEERAPRLWGIVLDPDGAGIPRAEIEIKAEGSELSTHADEAGFFRLLMRDRRPCSILARDPNGRYRPARAAGIVPGDRECRLRLQDAPQLALVVRDRKGRAIESYGYNVLSEADGSALAISAQQGRPPRTILAVPAEPFLVEVLGNGWITHRSATFAADAAMELLIELDPAGGLGGTVRHAGSPIGGARVRLVEGLRAKTTFNGFPLRTSAEPVIETETDANGAYLASVDRAGDYFLQVLSAGLALFEAGPFSLDANSNRIEDAELLRGGSIEVVYRSDVGANPAGRLVAASRGDGRAFTLRTDAEGRAVFASLTPGPWQVELVEREIDPRYGETRFGSEPTKIPFNCQVFDEDVTRVVLPMEKEPDTSECVVSGLLTIDGKPARGWAASLEREESSAAGPEPLDESGGFSLAVASPGPARLTLRSPDADPTKFLVVLEELELFVGVRRWSLDLRTGAAEGPLEALPEGEMAFLRCQQGRAQVLAPLIPGSDGLVRAELAPAGACEIVRLRGDVPLGTQAPIVLRAVTIEVGGRTRL